MSQRIHLSENQLHAGLVFPQMKETTPVKKRPIVRTILFPNSSRALVDKTGKILSVLMGPEQIIGISGFQIRTSLGKNGVQCRSDWGQNVRKCVDLVQIDKIFR